MVQNDLLSVQQDLLKNFHFSDISLLMQFFLVCERRNGFNLQSFRMTLIFTEPWAFVVTDFFPIYFCFVFLY